MRFKYSLNCFLSFRQHSIECALPPKKPCNMEGHKDPRSLLSWRKTPDQSFSQESLELKEEYISLAKEATRREHALTFMQAVRLYPKSIGWSLLISTAIIMEAFQLLLIEQFLAYPAFREKFGSELPDGTYQLSALWQTALVNGACVGTIFGLWINGWISDHFGYKKTILGALTSITLFIFIPFFATNVGLILLGQVLMGVPWGVFQTVAVSYAAEVSPTRLRAYLTTYINMCWLIGQIIASGILQGFVVRMEGEWAYRLPIAFEWAWPIPLILGILFAPESPWWLVRKHRIQDAKISLRRLTSNRFEPERDVDMNVALILVTTKLEKENGTGTTYRDCFIGVNLRRTVISCAVSSMQTLSGAGLGAYSTYFYERAGLSTDHAFTMTVGQYGLGILGVFCTWSLLSRFGRRTMFLSGLSMMASCLLLIGLLGLIPPKPAASWTIGSLFVVYQFILNTTVASVCFSLVAEIPSTRLRTKTVVLARIAYSILSIFSNVITPFMLNPMAWNWGAKAGFFWGGLCLLSAIYTYFHVPEPKGRTFGEMDVLFHRKISARKFAKTAVLETRKSDSVSSMSSAGSWIDKLKPAHSSKRHENDSTPPPGMWTHTTEVNRSTRSHDSHILSAPEPDLKGLSQPTGPSLVPQIRTSVPSPCLHVTASSCLVDPK